MDVAEAGLPWGTISTYQSALQRALGYQRRRLGNQGEEMFLQRQPEQADVLDREPQESRTPAPQKKDNQHAIPSRVTDRSLRHAV